MEKQKMLYISPFWPQKSGISEYSETLIWGLEKLFDITILVDGYSLENKQIRKHFYIEDEIEKIDYEKYDILLYNFGNNPYFHEYMYEMLLEHPGYIILHDVSLYYLTVEFYKKKNLLFSKIYELEEIKGIIDIKESFKINKSRDLLDHKNLSSEIPMNKEVFERALGILVHSDYAREIVLKKTSNVSIYKIHFVECNANSMKKKRGYLRKRFSIEEDAYIFVSAGYIAPSKQNDLCCKAIKQYNSINKKKIYYVMVGEGKYADEYLDEYIYKTDFITTEDFFNAIYDSDAVLNLRYPYNGESSATLIQSMAMGKICVVSDIGWFSELPDQSVKKVSPFINEFELCDEISKIIHGEYDLYKKKGKKFVSENCTPDIVAKEIGAIIHKKDDLSNKDLD